jgi:hypothetical protein
MAATVETAVVNKMLTDAKPKLLNSKLPPNMLSKTVMLSYTSTIMLVPIKDHVEIHKDVVRRY